MNAGEYNYAIEPFNAAFHNDWEANVKFLSGPIGCGKSWTSLWELVLHACRVVPPTQRKYKGERKARYAIIRKTYPRLESTVLVSMEKIFRKALDITRGYPMTARVTVPDPYNAGEFIDLEFLLLAIADETNEDELKKLRSLELTGAFINEVDEFDTDAIIGAVFSRCGRYPDGVKEITPTGMVDVTINGRPVAYTGQNLVIADFNKTLESHWLCKWHRNKNNERPDGVAFYDYPSPLLEIKDTNGTVVGYEPNQEAMVYASKQSGGIGYWLEQVELNKHNPEFINTLILNRYGSTRSGKAVFSAFRPELHIIKGKIVPNPNVPIFVGFDHSGLNPAMAFMQYSNKGIVIFDELVAFDIPPDEFIHSIFVPFVTNKRWQRSDLTIICDPADPRGRSIGGDLTMVRALHKLGFTRSSPANSSWGRDPARMIATVNETLSRGLLYVGQEVKWAREAFEGAYVYKKVNTNAASVMPKPADGPHTHIADAIQYAVCTMRLGNAYKPQTPPVEQGGFLDSLA